MFEALSRNALYRLVCTLLWFLILVGLPLTSFPLISRLTGAIVAPFSALPLGLLALAWLVPYLLNKGQWPGESLPLFYFVLAVVGITALGFFLDGVYLKGRDFFDQSLRAFITLAIGLSFYLVFSTFPREERVFRQTLVFLYIGGGLLMAWTLFEVVMLRQYERVIYLPDWITRFRSLLAVQSPNVRYTNRVTGFAYEPSWFVRQFNLIFFPLWFSASFQRVSLFRWRFWRFQLEDFLLIPALLVFIFSAPRVGMLAFLMILAYLGLLLFNRLTDRVTRWVMTKRRQKTLRVGLMRFVMGLLLAVLLIVVGTGFLAGFVTFASRWDDRYLLFFTGGPLLGESGLFPITVTTVLNLGRRLAFYERLIYWFAGWRIFNDYPLGVGLGNAGFYFFERMDGIAYNSYEIRDIVFRAGSLPNTKNMWVRLLAETGIIGTLLFVVWLIILWWTSGGLWKSHSRALNILGLGGQLCLAAYVMEGFSMDSFAMPYLWVMMGLVAAGGAFVRAEEKSQG